MCTESEKMTAKKTMAQRHWRRPKRNGNGCCSGMPTGCLWPREMENYRDEAADACIKTFIIPYLEIVVGFFWNLKTGCIRHTLSKEWKKYFFFISRKTLLRTVFFIVPCLWFEYVSTRIPVALKGQEDCLFSRQYSLNHFYNLGGTKPLSSQDFGGLGCVI